jgi:hypothetical protein
LDYQYTLNSKKWMAGGNNESFPVMGTCGWGWAQGKGEWGWTWWIDFVFIYGNRKMKPVEIILRKEGEEGEQWRG